MSSGRACIDKVVVCNGCARYLGLLLLLMARLAGAGPEEEANVMTLVSLSYIMNSF